MFIFVTACHILFIFLLVFLFHRKEKFLKKVFWPALLIKLLSGICLGLLYTYYYPVGDTLAYFRDGNTLAAAAIRDYSSYIKFLFFNAGLPDSQLIFSEPRALFLTKIVSVFSLVTFRNYWVISAYFSLASFFASWFLVRTIHRYAPAVSTASVVAFLFLPSVVFWTSGLIKESLAVGALYFLTAFFLKIMMHEKIQTKHFLLMPLSLWIFWNLKYYFMAIFLPVVCATLLCQLIFRKRLQRSAALETLVWLVVFMIPLVGISFLHPNFYPGRFLNVIVQNNAAYNLLSDPEDLIHFTSLQATPASVLRNAPRALFSGLFRPFFWETRTTLQLLAGVENLLLFVFFVSALTQTKKYLTSPHRMLVLAMVVYISLLCILITLSAPNFGTLSRYRGGYLSFFTFLILCNNPLVNYLQRSFQRLVSH